MSTLFILGLCLSRVSESSSLEHATFHNKTIGETKFSVKCFSFS